MATLYKWGKYNIVFEPVYRESSGEFVRDSNGNPLYWSNYDGYTTSTRIGERPVKGRFYEYVTSTDRNAYPDNSFKGGYWYEYVGVENQSPTITGSKTSIGNVNNDFNITYVIDDPDGDEVKVQIMVDDKIVQYPMVVPNNREQTIKVKLADYTLGDHNITVTATDPSNASASRKYSFKKTNQSPTISGADMDLGGVFKDIPLDYIVQDADGDTVKVEIKLDGKTVMAPTNTTLGVRRYYTVGIKNLSLGKHTLEIIATDVQGASSVRTYTFQKVNSAPVISGQDESLGPKNTGFTYRYTVTDNEEDNVKVVEKLNGSILRTLNNAPLGNELSITISDDSIRELELNRQNTIEIEASDGVANTYRRITFIRNNMPPIIADSDRDLGDVTNSLEYAWSATDPEKEKIFATIYLDEKIIKARHEVPDGANQVIRIEGLDMQKITRGKHTIRIVVEDEKGFKSIRTITFNRVIERLIMQLANKGIATDELANRVLVSDAGVYVAPGASVKYEVCNNSHDEEPTWEDATTMVGAGKAFYFQNKNKTNEQAGINIRVTIERGTATLQSYIQTIGGSFD